MSGWKRSRIYAVAAMTVAALLAIACIPARRWLTDRAWQSHLQLSETALAHRDPATADSQLRLALREARKFGPEDMRCGVTLNRIGELQLTCDRPIAAEQPLRESLAICTKALGAAHLDTARVMHNLAVSLDRQGKYAESESLHKASLTVREAALGPMHPDVAASLNDLAVHYGERGGREREEETLMLRAIDIRKRVLGESDGAYAQSLYNCAALRTRQGRLSEASELLTESLAVTTRACGPDSASAALCLGALADVHVSQGKEHWAQAEREARACIALYERLNGPDHPSCRRGLKPLLRLLKATSRHTEAQAVETRLQRLKRAFDAAKA